MAVAKKTEFHNQSQGYVGVVKINRKGDDVGEPVAPGERVFLTQDEIAATEQSHVKPEGSPFADREIVIRDEHTGDEVRRFTGPQLKRVPQRRPRSA